MTDAPNCWKCRFFKISWDPKFPYECEAMGFKSHGLPCAQVLSVDGRECQSFAVKRVNSNQKQPLDKINRSTDRSA
ncbi:MAG: uracil-DNA glycosylase [Gammaproteobacteria bacterium]|nr:uracil-DNA glycosylase [Gammaproteobacteria bacterium]